MIYESPKHKKQCVYGINLWYSILILYSQQEILETLEGGVMKNLIESVYSINGKNKNWQL